jgi:hypothetical protein
VRQPGLTVIALPGHASVGVEDDGANHRIGAGPVVRLARELDGACGPMQVYVSVGICGIQSWQYTRAKSNHSVINNRKVYEILQCFQRWIR